MLYSDDDENESHFVQIGGSCISSIPPPPPKATDGEDEVATIRVIAPATLAEGYSFDVMVDDEPYTVEVPKGGVKEGQEFEVLYEPHIYGGRNSSHHRRHRSSTSDRRHRGRYMDELKQKSGLKEYDNDDDDGDDEEEGDSTRIQESATLPVRTMSEDEDNEHEKEKVDRIWYDDMTGAPIGRWRTTLCSCCDVMTQSTFWMGLCCAPVLIAQLLTRLGLSWNGRSGVSDQEKSLSFNRIVIATMIALAVWKIPVAGDLVLLVFYLVIVVHIGAQVRHHMRQKYKIPPTLPTRCGHRMEDGCCMVFCGCCSAIQMARHTHDDKEFPGHGCTTTGLEVDAPQIV